MKWVKRIALSISFLIIISMGWYFSEVVYGLRQLTGQLKILNNVVQLEDYLANSENPDSIKQKLRLIIKVKEFATEYLDYENSENYTTVFDQKGKDILWVVTACHPFKFEPKVWRFPFLGEVPYKGHFNLERAIAEARELEKENWDVSVRTVSAWSTLGWFDDPVLTGMLDRNDGELAELILHELTHGTLFVKDSVEFNENLASFIGVKAARLFLISEFGENSSEYNEYIISLDDQQKLINFMLQSASALDSLYNTFSGSTDSTNKIKLKQKLIETIIEKMDTVSFKNKIDYLKFFSKRKPNNAFFMNFIRYNSMEPEFEQLLQNKFEGNLKSFLDFFRTKYPSL